MSSAQNTSTSAKNEYLYDQFIDEPDKSPQEQHRENLKKFLNNYCSNLSQEIKNFDEEYHELFANSISDALHDPIKFRYDPADTQRFDELFQSDNKALTKVVLVVAHLTWELNNLKETAEKKFFPTLSIYGDAPVQKNKPEQSQASEEGEKQLQFGRTIPFLLDLWNFVGRVNQVVKNTVQQLASLYSTAPITNAKEEAAGRKTLLTFQKIHFLGLFSALADALGVLISFDEIIRQNSSFQTHLTLYKRMISRVMAEPERFNTTKENAGKINYLLQKIDGDLLDDAIFKSCMNQNFNDFPGLDPQRNMLKQNKQFKQEFEHNVNTYATLIMQPLGTPQENEKRVKLVGVAGLYVLYNNIFLDTSDKKLFKALWDSHKKAPVIHVFGNTVWQPGEFLLKWVPDMIRLIGIKNPRKEMIDAKKAALLQQDQSLAASVNMHYLGMCIWTSRIESNFDNTYSSSIQEDQPGTPRGTAAVAKNPSGSGAGQLLLGVHGTLILQGIQLGYTISNLLKNTLYVHIHNDQPLTVSQVILLCRCIEMLKSIYTTYHRKSVTIAQYLSILCEYLSYKIQKILMPLKQRLEQKRSLTPQEVDQLSSVNVALNLLQSAPSKKRILLIRLALAIALQKGSGLIRENDFEDVRTYLRRLDMIANFESILEEACDCTVLYWSRPLIHTFFQHVYENPIRVPELKYIFAAIQDAGYKLLQGNAKHLATPDALYDAYGQEILDSFENSIIQPLCTAIETDLRLHIHSSVIGSDTLTSRRQNLDVLLKASGGQQQLKDLTTFFKIEPIQFFNHQNIDIKRAVSNYLDQTFYNLTTIAQRDWKTYEEMRGLAQEKYGLELINVYLPGQTTEQGLDVLEITRNIHVFVSRFSYNLNNNLFIERCSATEAKNLNTIHIKHVANSIRTHGTGIMNTTVNFVYKFLTRKFFVFSQFLYDDHIKSRLIKDIRYFKDNVQQNLSNNAQLKQQGGVLLTAVNSKASSKENDSSMSTFYQYPLKKAEKFVKDIKKLGVSPQGHSYLDQFRILITELGNALGYVRMVRAGGLRYISDAIKFVPDLDQIENFEELCENVNAAPNGTKAFSEQTKLSAKNLYAALTNLRQKFAEGSDYFKVLERVFTTELQRDKNNHLRNFYIIVPPLTISYVESMLIAKDKMVRTGKEANFTDDGFALGVAFILKILDQNSKFDSLHWFSSIKSHYDAEYERIKSTINEKSVKKNSNAEEELQTMRLTMNRIQSYQREFELLFFSFSGSRVFFRD